MKEHYNVAQEYIQGRQDLTIHSYELFFFVARWQSTWDNH